VVFDKTGILQLRLPLVAILQALWSWPNMFYRIGYRHCDKLA